MKHLIIREEYVNRTENARYGFTGKTETGHMDVTSLYNDLKAEYGRPKKMFITNADGTDDVQTGWVFTKKMKYDDCKDTYVREVWVEVFDPHGNRFDFKAHAKAMQKKRDEKAKEKRAAK